MKTNRIRLFSERQILMVILLMGLYLVAGSCDDDDHDNNSDVFRATLNGASEVPPNGSTATGTATLTYNKDTRLFSIVVEYTGITPNAGHIHLGEVGEAGNVVFGFESSLASPINYTSPALTETQENDLYAHQYYVNLHTTLYPGGEIRGQLILK
jgi:hypothetical protein